MVALTSHSPLAWVLNFDAEEELQSNGYTRSAKTNARLPALVEALRDLIHPLDIVLDDSNRNASGYGGRAWCPTPQALARIAQSGATVPPAPEVTLLRRVNHRLFCAELGQSLPNAKYVTANEALLDVIALPTRSGHWLLKRPFGFAGRGRRRVACGALEPSAETWVVASLRGGGLQVEPWVERRGDYAIHGFITRNRAATLGEPTQQSCDPTGAWLGTSPITDLTSNERGELVASAERVRAALIHVGYFGPFGVDAYRYDDGDRCAFNARSEINARYSMGWAIGMGSRRPDRATLD